MTKSEKQQYQEEYERGEHMLTLEQYIKEEQKQKRSQKGRDETLVRKIARELLSGTMEELERLRAENADLKKRIEQLTADDVPAAEPERVQTPEKRPVSRPDVKAEQAADMDSDIPVDDFHASRAARVFGERGLKIVKALDKAANSGEISWKTANELARGLGLERTYNYKNVVPCSTSDEQSAREKFVAGCRKLIAKIENGEA